MTGSVDSEVVTVEQSRAQRMGVMGGIAAVLALGSARGLTSNNPSTPTTVASIVVAVVAVAFVVFLVRMALHPATLLVSDERIRMVGPGGRKRPELIKTAGPDVQVNYRGSGRSSSLWIEQPAASIAWSIPWFSRNQVISACQSRGWQTGS